MSLYLLEIVMVFSLRDIGFEWESYVSPEQTRAHEIQGRRRRLSAILTGAFQVPVVLVAVNPWSQAFARLALYFLFLEACMVVLVSAPTFAYYKLWKRLSWRDSLRETTDSIFTAFEGFAWPG